MTNFIANTHYNHLIMKKILLVMAALMAFATGWAEDKPWEYVDATDLRIINRGWNCTSSPYTRLPAYLQDSVRPDLWQRQSCSSGIAVRFATNSTRIGIKYQLTYDTHMIHMADTGLKGADLYIWDPEATAGANGNKWMHVNCIRPYLKDKENKIVESTFVENLSGEMQEFMVYLPLYDGVEQMWIKVDSAATITEGSLELISPAKKVVAYGTSILQGGCASRPGMCGTSILSRELNCEVINLGFSGEGKLDSCVARAMATIPDVDVFVIDPVPNCTYIMCDSLTYGFVDILRSQCPDAKIVMVEGPLYPYSRYNSYFADYLPLKNEYFRKNFELLAAENPDNIYYVTAEGLDGPEDDGTVDGIHLTDLGFRHYANKLMPVLYPLLYGK